MAGIQGSPGSFVAPEGLLVTDKPPCGDRGRVRSSALHSKTDGPLVASPGANAGLTVRSGNAPRSVVGLVRRGEHAGNLRVDGRSNPQPHRSGFGQVDAVSRGTGRGSRERRFAAADGQGELSSP
jgi:hypothetical protein